MQTKQTDEQEKRPYKKPELMQVPLKPEEAVLGNCKFGSGTSGPSGGGPCSSPVPCFNLGS